MNSDHFIKLAHTVGVPILKLSVETMTKVNVAPQAQNRTALHKKGVYILEGLVFKGPYTCEEQMLMKNLRYTYAIKLLEAALQLHEWQRGSLRWEYLGWGADDQCYLVAKNVGRCENIPFERVTTKIETDVKVVPRGKFVMRVSDIERNGQLTDDVKLATLQHLYLRFLLDIGDSGTNNVLIRKDWHSSGRLIAGIDLEETRSNKGKNSRLNLLFSKLYKKHFALYKSDISKIKSLSYSQLDRPTLDRLSAVGIDLKRLKENMELWVKTPI